MTRHFSAVSAAPFLQRSDVQDRIEQQILTAHYLPGQRLPSERAMCLEYGVSRPVIREVLHGLQERGYIDVYPGRGSFVRQIQSDDLADPLARMATRLKVTPRNLVEARTMLECKAVEIVATSATEAQLRRIELTLEEHNRAEGLGDRARSDLNFHESIVGASQNPVIEIMYGAIRTLVYGLMLRSHSDRDVRQAGDPWHQAIFAAIRERNVPAAVAAMSQHLELAITLYGEDLDAALGDVLARRGIDVIALSKSLK